MESPEGALNFAVALAREAGAIMKENFALGMQKEWKENDTPLTATDKRVNALVIERIQEQYPGHSIVAEEGSAITDNEYVWVCDPVDGTTPFSHGYPIFVGSLALTKNGGSILGVVYDPILDRLFTAEKGNGAYLNGKRFSASSAREFSRTSLISVDGEARFPSLRQKIRDTGASALNMFSCVYTSMLVASGEFVATIFGNDTPWDAAAVKIIVEEAGGRVTNLRGEEQAYHVPTNGFIASNGPLHQEIVELVRSSLK